MKRMVYGNDEGMKKMKVWQGWRYDKNEGMTRMKVWQEWRYDEVWSYDKDEVNIFAKTQTSLNFNYTCQSHPTFLCKILITKM